MDKIILNGIWECTLPDNRQITVYVPGCWDTYTDQKNIGDPVHFKKVINIDKALNKRYFLYFGGVSYYCDIFVNDRLAGSHEGMWDNFRIEITEQLITGDNVIEIAITKPAYKKGDRFPVREVLSGFIPDVLCTFGGIWDDAYIECCEEFLIQSHYAKGDAKGIAEINVRINAFEKSDFALTAVVYSLDGTNLQPISKDFKGVLPGDHDFMLECLVDNPMLWDTENANLYKYRLTIDCNNSTQIIEKYFGFRDIACNGSKIILNDRPVYLRGILHWGYYDDEIIPNPSQNVIQSEIELCKKYGFNMIKHCLYIPREEYLELADKKGMLLWVELPLWIPEVTPQLSQRIEREYPQLIRQIMGHPSVVMLSLGCELDSKVDTSILKKMYNLAKAQSNTLVRDNSGSGECFDGSPVDFADFFDYHFYADLQNMENLMEAFTPTWRSYRPWLFGEFCDSDTMRSLKKIREKKGVEVLFWEQGDTSKNPICTLKPDFFAHMHDGCMEKSGILEEFELLSELSLNHSMVHRKTTLEYTRSFPEICGYNITCIRDVPIASSGMFDDFMQPKFDFAEVRKFNSDIVLAPAWDLTRIWINADRVMNKERYNFFSGDYYGLHIIISNYSQSVLEAPVMEWELLCDKKIFINGKTSTAASFVTGDVKELGYISLILPEVTAPQSCVISVVMRCGDRTVVNSWPVFIYPKPKKSNRKIGLYDPANVFTAIDALYDVISIEDDSAVTGFDVVLTSRLTPEIREYARAGGKVFFVQRAGGYLPAKKISFWREGMIRQYYHMVLDGIEYKEWFDDLRFFSLSTDTAFQTEQFDKLGFDSVTSIIRRYDCREWEATDYMTEIKAGKGTIIATTLRFEGGMGKQPMFIGNNKFAVWLLNSIIRFFNSEDNFDE